MKFTSSAGATRQTKLQLQDKQQLDRARHWQTQRMRKAVAQIHSGQNPEVNEAEIDKVFSDAGTPAGRRNA